MTDKPLTIFYMPLAQGGGFDAEAIENVNEVAFIDLFQRAESQLAANKFDEALKIASKSALLYGLPGIIVYLRTALIAQIEDNKNGNLSAQKVFDNLALSLLAKKLAEQDECADEMMSKYLSQNYQETVKTCDELIESFIKLRREEFTNYLGEANIISEKLLQMCLESNQCHMKPYR